MEAKSKSRCLESEAREAVERAVSAEAERDAASHEDGPNGDRSSGQRSSIGGI